MTTNLRKFYETGNQVHDDSVVCVFEDFLAEEEIQALLAAVKPKLKLKLKQALVSAGQTGVESAGRSGSNCWIPHGLYPVIEELSLRVAEVVGIGLEYAESLQVVHYAETQEYAPNYGAWDAGTERGQRCMAKGGQRMVTCLLYLDEPEEGGGTSFPNLDMEVRARKDRKLLFHNCYPSSVIRHPDSLHVGMPVLSGEKWPAIFGFGSGNTRRGLSSRARKTCRIHPSLVASSKAASNA